MHKDKTKIISLIIPCKNEAGTIGLAIEKAAALPGVAEIIIVEGNSNDQTHQIAEESLLKLKFKLDTTLMKQNKTGKWDAVKLGIENSSQPIISIWDADLTVSPDEQKMIHNIFLDNFSDNKLALVTGNRMQLREPGSMKFFNVIGNHLFAYLWSQTARQKISDSLCGSKIFEKKALGLIPDSVKNSDPYGDFSIIACAIISRKKIIQVPITYRARSYGQSNIARWRGGIQLLKVWIRLFKYVNSTRI